MVHLFLILFRLLFIIYANTFLHLSFCMKSTILLNCLPTISMWTSLRVRLRAKQWNNKIRIITCDIATVDFFFFSSLKLLRNFSKRAKISLSRFDCQGKKLLTILLKTSLKNIYALREAQFTSIRMKISLHYRRHM